MRKVHPVTIKALGQSSLSRQILNLNRRLAQENARDRKPDTLDDLTDDMGEITGGQLRAIEAADPTDVTANGAFFDAAGVLFNDGNTYHVGGVNDGRLMFGLRATDGAGVFAGGRGIIDADAIHMSGIMYALEHLAYDTSGTANPRRARLEMVYPEGGTIPALNLSFADATDYPELLSNGDFESGTTDWTAVTGGAGDSFTVVDGVAILTRAALAGDFYIWNSAGFLAAPRASYEVVGSVWSDSGGSRQVQVTVRWLNVGGVTIGETLVENQATTGAPIPVTNFARTVTAPAGSYAATVLVRFIGSSGVISVDGLSVKYVSFAHNLTIDDNGISVLKWATPTTAGVDQDTNVAATNYDQTLQLNVKRGLKITGFRWDIRNNGDYVIRHTYSRNRLDSFGEIASFTVSSPGEITITLAEPVVLTPGEHYFALVRPAGVVTWWDTNLARYVASDGSFAIGPVSYNGTEAARIAPVKLEYQPGEWS